MKVLQYIVVFFLVSCGQQEPNKNQPTSKIEPKETTLSSATENIIGENSIGKAYIDMSVEDLKKLIQVINFLDTPVYYFGLDGEDRELVIAKK